MRKLYVVASFIIALFMMFARPAAADTVLTLKITSEIAMGDFTLDMTTDQILSWSLDMGAPGDLQQSSNGVSDYIPDEQGCGPGSLGCDELDFVGSNGIFQGFTAFPLVTRPGIDGDNGFLNAFFCSPPSIGRGCAFTQPNPPAYGGDLTLVSETIPEPSSAVLLATGLALLLFRLEGDSSGCCRAGEREAEQGGQGTSA